MSIYHKVGHKLKLIECDIKSSKKEYFGIKYFS